MRIPSCRKPTRKEAFDIVAEALYWANMEIAAADMDVDITMSGKFSHGVVTMLRWVDR